MRLEHPNVMLYLRFAPVLLLSIVSVPHYSDAQSLPEGFVYLDSVIPDIVVDLRYHSTNNFIGDIIDGYESDRCVVSADAASALKGAQDVLRGFGLELKIFDAYRPQRAVDHFVRWAADTTDVRNKALYYPAVPKSELFERGYIAAKSGHTRGSTLDLTLIDRATGDALDMGSSWDFLDERSHILYPGVSAQQRANRMLLNRVMTESGFRPYSEEWWHFTLENEAFPDTYFNFVIEQGG